LIKVHLALICIAHVFKHAPAFVFSISRVIANEKLSQCQPSSW